MKGEIPYVIICVSVYIMTAVVIKTWLEVPDDRLFNAVTLSDLCNSDDAHKKLLPFYRAKCGQLIWMIL